MNATLHAYRHTFRSMGTTIEILLVGAQAAHPEAIATFALAESLANEWERTFSRFRPESELSRLNAQAGRTVVVSPRLYTAIELAIDAARRTGGLFDPTVLPALIALGYDRTFDDLHDHEGAPVAPVPAPGMAGIIQDPGRRTVQLSDGVQLDLGGIVKGLYADVLARIGPWSGGAVSAGGDLRVWGVPPEGEQWIIGVEHPDDPRRDVMQLRLAAGAVATSGTNRRAWRRAGAPVHHLIDPRTGQPAASGIRTASVVSTTAVHAEIAATALVVGGPATPSARSLVQQAILIREDGQLVTIEGNQEGHVDVVDLTTLAGVAAHA